MRGFFFHASRPARGAAAFFLLFAHFLLLLAGCGTVRREGTADGMSGKALIAAAAPAYGAFSFAVISDTHTGGTLKTGKKVYARIIDMLNERRPDFLVHCGDWIIAPTFDKAGDATKDTFLTYTALLDSSIGFYPVLGNHEADYEGFEYARSVFPVFGEKGWYSFDHGNAHFFIVENNSDASDSTLRGYRSCRPNGRLNTPGSKQRKWLAGDLAGRGDGTIWTFGFGHRAYYGAEGYSGRKNVFEARRGDGAFCREIEDSGVDIFFNGDQHCYTRSTPIRDGVMWSETDSSTVYITAGGGGGRINRGSKKKLEFPVLDDLPEGTFVTGTKTKHFFVYCTVSGPLFHAEVIDTSGVTIDSFTIRK